MCACPDKTGKPDHSDRAPTWLRPGIKLICTAIAGVLNSSSLSVNQRLKGPVSKEGSGACDSDASADKAGSKITVAFRCFANATTFQHCTRSHRQFKEILRNVGSLIHTYSYAKAVLTGTSPGGFTAALQRNVASRRNDHGASPLPAHIPYPVQS